MKKYTPVQALEKIRHYCAYQERSHQETRKKLYDCGLYTSDVENIISQLITDGFLNEERYAKAFAGGKFRIKKWGKLKIGHDLELKGVNKNCLKIALKEIGEQEYLATLHEVIEKKFTMLKEENLFIKKDKVAKYAIQRGFEPELVWKKLKEIAPN